MQTFGYGILMSVRNYQKDTSGYKKQILTIMQFLALLKFCLKRKTAKINGSNRPH